MGTIIELVIENKLKAIHHSLKKLEAEKDNIGLMGGLSGQILFQYHFYTKYNGDGNALLNSIDELYSSLPNAKVGFTYSFGLSGIFDVLNYLNQKDIIDDGYKDSENILLNSFNDSIMNNLGVNNLDFLHGGSGILKYLTSLIDATNINQHELILDEFIEKVIKKEDQVISFPSYNFNTHKHHDEINLSLSHGNSAIIIILLNFFLKTSSEKIEPLIKNIFHTFEFIKNQKNDRIISIYPHVENDKNESRLAWCYGDLGIASAFWQAGKVFNNTTWKQNAIDIMLHSAKRKNLKENLVTDAGICHGTAGIAHMFNRFYKETGRKEFDEARWYWLNETLKMATHADGLAGYKAWQGENDGWQNESGLLEGVAGIGLVLLGFVTDDIEDLSWDRFLLLS